MSEDSKTFWPVIVLDSDLHMHDITPDLLDNNNTRAIFYELEWSLMMHFSDRFKIESFGKKTNAIIKIWIWPTFYLPLRSFIIKIWQVVLNIPKMYGGNEGFVKTWSLHFFICSHSFLRCAAFMQGLVLTVIFCFHYILFQTQHVRNDRMSNKGVFLYPSEMTWTRTCKLSLLPCHI